MAVIKLEGDVVVPGFGCWLRVWVALVKLEGNWRVLGLGLKSKGFEAFSRFRCLSTRVQELYVSGGVWGGLLRF